MRQILSSRPVVQSLKAGNKSFSGWGIGDADRTNGRMDGERKPLRHISQSLILYMGTDKALPPLCLCCAYLLLWWGEKSEA